MRIYLEFIKNAFQTSIAYRLNVFLHLVGRILLLFIQVSIWRALYGGAAEVNSNLGMVSLSQMITYSIVSVAISIFAGTSIITNPVFIKVEEGIKSGQIAMDLIKPLNFRNYLFAESIGVKVFKLLFELIPLLVIGSSLFGILIPHWPNLILFVITLGIALIIHFLITYLMALLGFWYLDAWHLGKFMEDLVYVMSGALVPLWFFPDFLARISEFLPFRLVYYTPIAIFLEKITVQESLGVIGQQLLWVGILYLLVQLIWSRAVNKLVVQGG